MLVFCGLFNLSVIYPKYLYFCRLLAVNQFPQQDNYWALTQMRPSTLDSCTHFSFHVEVHVIFTQCLISLIKQVMIHICTKEQKTNLYINNLNHWAAPIHRTKNIVNVTCPNYQLSLGFLIVKTFEFDLQNTLWAIENTHTEYLGSPESLCKRAGTINPFHY